MSALYYRLLSRVAASLSLASLSLVVVGCGANPPADPVTGATPAPTAATSAVDPIGTDATLWTVLGLAKRESEQEVGPQTGDTVSPILWQAAQDTLHFAGIASEDPMSGFLVTNWYSPPGKPDERLRVSAFILSRALRSDSVAVSVERQAGAAGGQWNDTPVARDVVTGLENAILQRARQIHAERYRDTMYK